MSTSPLPVNASDPSFDFASFLAQVRPRLHRYCARMAGSALDGEDIVQEALSKAALNFGEGVRQPEAWLFRVAHNAAMDFLRRRSLERSVFVDTGGDVDEAASEEADDPHAQAEATAAALALFMELPPAQRGAVILADVLGHALREIADIQGATVPAVKAALHRGRLRLRELGALARTEHPAALPAEAQALVNLYAQRFNARDFDGLRALLADEVRLQLAGRAEMKGKAQVAGYFGNYEKLQDRLHAVPAAIEGRAGLWIHEHGSAEPAYAIVLQVHDGQLATIRDFRYARYVSDILRPAPIGR